MIFVAGLLAEIRFALEEFAANPNEDTFSNVQDTLRATEWHCESEILEEENV